MQRIPSDWPINSVFLYVSIYMVAIATFFLSPETLGHRPCSFISVVISFSLKLTDLLLSFFRNYRSSDSRGGSRYDSHRENYRYESSRRDNYKDGGSYRDSFRDGGSSRDSYRDGGSTRDSYRDGGSSRDIYRDKGSARDSYKDGGSIGSRDSYRDGGNVRDRHRDRESTRERRYEMGSRDSDRCGDKDHDRYESNLIDMLDSRGGKSSSSNYRRSRSPPYSGKDRCNILEILIHI